MKVAHCTLVLYSMLVPVRAEFQRDDSDYSDYKQRRDVRIMSPVSRNHNRNQMTAARQRLLGTAQANILKMKGNSRPTSLVNPAKFKIGEVTGSVPSAGYSSFTSNATSEDYPERLVDSEQNEDYDSDDAKSQRRLSSLTLDDILKSPKGQEIIMEEVEKRVLKRMELVINEVGEEIVEAMENDAVAAMIEHQENPNGTHKFKSPITLVLLVAIYCIIIIISASA